MQMKTGRRELTIYSLVIVFIIILVFAWVKYESSFITVVTSSEREVSNEGLRWKKRPRHDGEKADKHMLIAKKNEEKTRRLMLKTRMRDVRQRMKTDELNRSEFLGQWKKKYGYQAAFLIKAPKQRELKIWQSLLGVYPDYSKIEKDYVNAYSDQLRVDFHFSDNVRYKLLIIDTDLTHEDVVIRISNQPIQTRDSVVGKGGEITLPTIASDGFSVGEIDLSDIDQNWRYSELLDLSPLKAAKTSDE